MNILTTILHSILAVAFLFFGGIKVITPIPDLIQMGMLWIEDLAVWQVRVITILEVLGALGLILPYTIKFLPKILVSLAAAGLGLIMIGAVITHVIRQDPIASIIVTTLLFAISTFVAMRRYRELNS